MKKLYTLKIGAFTNSYSQCVYSLSKGKLNLYNYTERFFTNHGIKSNYTTIFVQRINNNDSEFQIIHGNLLELLCI